MRRRRKLQPTSTRVDARSLAGLGNRSTRVVCPHESHFFALFQLHGDGLNVFSDFCTYNCSWSARLLTITSTTTPLPP